MSLIKDRMGLLARDSGFLQAQDEGVSKSGCAL